MSAWMFLCFFLFYPYQAFSWTAVNAQKNRFCSNDKPCFLREPQIEDGFKITTQVKKEGRKIDLLSVTIQSGAKKNVYDEIVEYPRIFESESFRFFSVDLNDDGFIDLALQASRHLKFGYYYLYWVFDPQTKQFVFNKEQFPKLTQKASSLVGEDGLEYKVGDNFQIKALSKEKKK